MATALRSRRPAADQRFSREEIAQRCALADRLSTGPSEHLEVNVHWEPTKPIGLPSGDVSHQYKVAVEVPIDWCDWTIQGDTLEALRLALAGGLEEMAGKLEGFIRLLRFEADCNRKTARKAARKA